MTTDASKIYYALVARFPQAMQDITALSKNTAMHKDFVISPVKAFNFDLVSNSESGQRIEKEKSPDALFLHDGALYFVEFKEGMNVEKMDIRMKIHEALLTLYQFAMDSDLLNRTEFFALSINYVVIMRNRAPKGSKESISGSFRKSNALFNLKNMEGFLIKEASTLGKPQAIANCLAKISNGAVTRIEIVAPDQQSREEFVPN